MEFNFGEKNTEGASRLGATSNSSRLQKAIERNRAKQAKRAGRLSGRSGEGLDLSGASTRTNSTLGQRRTSSRLPGSSPNLSSQARGIHKKQADQKSFSEQFKRRSVASGKENVEFTSSVKRPVKKAPAKASYTTIKTKSRPVKRRSRNLDKRTKYTICFLWCFLGFLLIRLIFSGGGVIDFYTNKNLLLSKQNEYQDIKLGNEEILKEIKMIKSDSKYQKKLVRDHLGFIAADEFVILFSKEKS